MSATAQYASARDTGATTPSNMRTAHAGHHSSLRSGETTDTKVAAKMASGQMTGRPVTVRGRDLRFDPGEPSDVAGAAAADRDVPQAAA